MTFPPPRYGTRRTPANPTRGGRVAYVAARIGTPLLGWQRLVADVGTEVDPVVAAEVTARRGVHLDAARQAVADADFTAAAEAVALARMCRTPWRYPVVIVLVPRQAGKTVLLRAVTVERSMSTPAAELYTTAQLGKYASARFMDTVKAVQSDPQLKDLVVARFAQGSESLTFPNTSSIKPFPPVEKSLHSTSPPFVGVDEAWAFDAAQGAMLDAAIRGAMLTRADRQLWVISAAGTDASEWLNAFVERGRSAVGDPASGIAYFEWSADPDADPYAPSTWDFHPAMGSLISRDTIRHEAEELSPGVFRRNILCLPTATMERAISAEAWDALYDGDMPAPPTSAVTLAYDVAADRSESAIMAAWPTGTAVCARVVKAGPGMQWLAPAVTDLVARWSPACVGADDGGPARQVTDDLRATGIDVQTLGARDFATATGDLLAMATETPTRLRHDGDPDWADEVAGAALRRLGQAEAWDRHASAAPIPRTIAATVAVRLAEHGPPVLPPPAVRFG